MRNKTMPLPSALAGLPDEAKNDIEWAEKLARSGRKAWLDIFAELRERLVAKGIEPPSFSAFNRHCMRLSGKGRRRG